MPPLPPWPSRLHSGDSLQVSSGLHHPPDMTCFSLLPLSPLCHFLPQHGQALPKDPLHSLYLQHVMGLRHVGWFGRNSLQGPWMTYYPIYSHLQLQRPSLWRYMASLWGVHVKGLGVHWNFPDTPLEGLLCASFFGLPVMDTSSCTETLSRSAGKSRNHTIKRPSCCNINILECFSVPPAKPVYCFKDK